MFPEYRESSFRVLLVPQDTSHVDKSVFAINESEIWDLFWQL